MYKRRTREYYEQRKLEQRKEREKLFYKLFTINNPYRSKDHQLANAKERELLRHAIYQNISRKRVRKLLKYFVIPCKSLTSYELKLLTDLLMISCVDVRLRRYERVRATQIGSNTFASYLVKENWKRESTNHLVWKFELKRKFGFRVEQRVRSMRVDLLKRSRDRKVYCEIVCTRQAVDKNFKSKITTLTKILEKQDIIVLLAPTRLHQYLQPLTADNVLLANAKTVVSLMKELTAQPPCADNVYEDIY